MATSSTEVRKRTESAGGSSQCDSMACAICYESYNKESRAPVTLICGHSFCASCVRKLNKGHKTLCCCLCRRHTVANHKRLGKNIAFLELLEKGGHLAKDEPTAAVQPKKEKDCCEACQNEDEDMPVVVAADSSDEDDDDEESDQQRIFNRAIQLLYDEVFDVERALADATDPEEAKVVKLKERLRTLQQAVDRTIETMNEAGKALNSVRKQIRDLRHDVSNEGIGPAIDFRPLDFVPLRGGVRRLDDVLNFTIDDDHFFEDFNDDDVNNVVIDENAYDDFVDDSDNDVPFMEILDEPDIERFMQQNYLRAADHNSDTNAITRVHCYLCDVHVEVPDFEGLQQLETHVRGVRHQQLQETNRREVRGASNGGNRQQARNGSNRQPQSGEPQYQVVGTMHINFIPNHGNDAWDDGSSRSNNTNNFQRPSFGSGRGGGFGWPRRGRAPSFFGGNDRPARFSSSANGFNNRAGNGYADTTAQQRPGSGSSGRGGGFGGGRGGNARNRRFTNSSNESNPPVRSGRQYFGDLASQNSRQSNYAASGSGSGSRNASNGQFSGPSRSNSQQFRNDAWSSPGYTGGWMDFSGPPTFNTPPPGFGPSPSNSNPGRPFGPVNNQPTVQQQAFYGSNNFSVPPPSIRPGHNGYGRNNSWNRHGNEGQGQGTMEVDRRTR